MDHIVKVFNVSMELKQASGNFVMVQQHRWQASAVANDDKPVYTEDKLDMPVYLMASGDYVAVGKELGAVMNELLSARARQQLADAYDQLHVAQERLEESDNLRKDNFNRLFDLRHKLQCFEEFPWYKRVWLAIKKEGLS